MVSVVKLRSDVPETRMCQCSHHMKIPRGWNLVYREKASRRKGFDIGKCGNYATHIIDGDPYCHAHGGAIALEKLARLTVTEAVKS